MTIDTTKNPDKMSQTELRAEVKAWRAADTEEQNALVESQNALAQLEIDSENALNELQAQIANRDTRMNELAEKVATMCDKAKIVHDEATALLMIGSK